MNTLSWLSKSTSKSFLWWFSIFRIFSQQPQFLICKASSFAIILMSCHHKTTTCWKLSLLTAMKGSISKFPCVDDENRWCTMVYHWCSARGRLRQCYKYNNCFIAFCLFIPTFWYQCHHPPLPHFTAKLDRSQSLFYVLPQKIPFGIWPLKR